MKKVVSVIGLVLSFLIIGYAVYLLIVNHGKINRDKIRINYENVINEDEEYLVNVTYDGKDNIKCSLDNIDYTSKCSFLLKEGNYKAYVTNEKDTSYKDFTVKKNHLGIFSSTIDVLDTYYLAVGGKKSFNFTFDYPEYFDKTVTYKVEDKNILKVENDIMYAVSAGTTKVTATLKDGNSKTYNVMVTDLIVSPTMAKKTLIVDIGSWTIDIMPVINKSPDESKCVTIPKGLITCMRSINEQCVRQLNGEVDESEIQNIMRYGRSDIDDEYFAIIKAEIEDFVDKVYNSIREFGYNLKTTPIVFVGGGAVVMKNFGSHDAKNISYNLDVKANARGYEQLATMGLKSTKRLS